MREGRSDLECAEVPVATGSRPRVWVSSIRWSRPGADKRTTGGILGGKFREGDHIVVDTRHRETFTFAKRAAVEQPP